MKTNSKALAAFLLSRACTIGTTSEPLAKETFWDKALNPLLPYFIASSFIGTTKPSNRLISA